MSSTGEKSEPRRRYPRSDRLAAVRHDLAPARNELWEQGDRVRASYRRDVRPAERRQARAENFARNQFDRLARAFGAASLCRRGDPRGAVFTRRVALAAHLAILSRRRARLPHRAKTVLDRPALEVCRS